MTVLRAQVSLESTTGLPEDVSMNVWHFSSATTPTTDDAADIVAHLDTFYSSLQDFYNEQTLTGLANVKVFDLLDAKPRAPILETSFSYAPLGEGAALPTECAVTMSFQGAAASGASQRRRRGRLYFGPLGTNASTTATGLVIVASGLTSALRAAAETMIGAGDPAHWSWIVFSPSNAGAEPWDIADLGNGSVLVDNGWTDNAFDTQRRRGTAPTLRDTFPDS